MSKRSTTGWTDLRASARCREGPAPRRGSGRASPRPARSATRRRRGRLDSSRPYRLRQGRVGLASSIRLGERFAWSRRVIAASNEIPRGPLGIIAHAGADTVSNVCWVELVSFWAGRVGATCCRVTCQAHRQGGQPPRGGVLAPSRNAGRHDRQPSSLLLLSGPAGPRRGDPGTRRNHVDDQVDATTCSRGDDRSRRGRARARSDRAERLAEPCRGHDDPAQVALDWNTIAVNTVQGCSTREVPDRGDDLHGLRPGRGLRRGDAINGK